VIRKITPTLGSHIYSSTSGGIDGIARTLWDVCIAGSGPGGAVAAATLAEAGWRVLLIERGAFHPADRLKFRFLDMPMRLGRPDVTRGARVALHQGNVLGGGSVIWGGVAMMPPKFVFDEWGEVSEVCGLSADALAPHYRYVASVMSVTRQQPELENRSNAIVRKMAAALGRPDGLELVQRYSEGCRGTGLCNVGCGFDLKGTMANSFLPIGLETGNLTVLTDCEALTLDGVHRASAFRATTIGVVLRHPVTGTVVSRQVIRAKYFIVASGAIHSAALLSRTPALARRSNPPKVWLQPHASIQALFDEPVTSGTNNEMRRHPPTNGVPAIYNFTGMLRDRGYSWFASVHHPASLATCAAHLPPDEHLELLSRFHYTSSVTTTIRDNPKRSQLLMRGDRPRLDFLESASDREILRRCLVDASRSLLAVGARRVFLPMLQPPRIERQSDVDAIEHAQMSYDRMLLYSDHMSGGNAIGARRDLGVTDADGRVFGSENVYVADSSLFPSPCGVGPSWTIMALSRGIASRLAAAGPLYAP
jgi:choline dehydrogenase-like flavoprotein